MPQPAFASVASRIALRLAGLLGGLWISGAFCDGGPGFNLYEQGRYVYERNCVICHGVRGDGQGELSENLLPKPRSFREGMFKFRTTPWGMLPTDEDLRRTITQGLTGTAMGMFSGLEATDLRAVIEYVKFFSRRWRHPENRAEAIVFPEPPRWLESASERGPHIAMGKMLFSTLCVSCHGPNAEGNGPAAGMLKDVWGQPSAPANLRQAHLRCGDSMADIYRVLSTGLNGTPMVSFEGTLTEPQRWQVSAYILSIRAEN